MSDQDSPILDLANSNAFDEGDILEERNGSPQPSPSAPSTKRRVEESPAPLGDAKKPKLTVKNEASKENSTAATTSLKLKDASKDALIEIKAGKFVIKQKPISWDNAASTMRARLAFTECVAEYLKDNTSKLSDWPKEQWNVVAHLVHESDKTASGVVQSIRKQLIDYVQGSLIVGDDSQEAEEEPKKDAMPLFERIPSAALKTLVESIAIRTNYGLELADLPSGLPAGVTEIPAGLQVWRWEVTDSALLPSEVLPRLEKRKAERIEIKAAVLALFTSLSTAEQTELLSKIAGGKKTKATKDATTASPGVPPSAAAAPSSDPAGPVASGSGITPIVPKQPPVKKAKVESAETAKEKEEKAKLKAEKEAEKEAEKLERARIKTEKDAERDAKKAVKDKAAAEKEEKKAKKIAAEEKKAAELARSSKTMMGFFIKKSASPAPPGPHATVASPVSASKPNESDFDRVFKPFNIKQDVTVAPTNRFAKANSGKSREVHINSLDTLTLQDSLGAFLSDVPKRRIILYNPHPEPPISVRDAVHAINESSTVGDSEGTSRTLKLLANRRKVPAKLLKFTEDVRPGYVGTWTKTSRVVGPRTPFGKDTALLRYDYDSEDEWEEEAVDNDAEDVNSGGERSDEEGGSEDEGLSDDWMCEDDEVEFEPGHEGEDAMPMDVDPDADLIIVETDQARKKILDRERKSKAAKESAKRKRLAGPLLPLVKGPVWETSFGKSNDGFFNSMKIQFLNDAGPGLNPFEWTSKPFSTSLSKPTAAESAAPEASTSKLADGASDKPKKAAKVGKAPAKPAKPFPSTLMPKFIGMVHGAEWNRVAMQELLHKEMKEHKVTKATIAQTLSDSATRVKGEGSTHTWQVNPAILSQYPASATRAAQAMVVD